MATKPTEAMLITKRGQALLRELRTGETERIGNVDYTRVTALVIDEGPLGDTSEQTVMVMLGTYNDAGVYEIAHAFNVKSYDQYIGVVQAMQRGAELGGKRG